MADHQARIQSLEEQIFQLESQLNLLRNDLASARISSYNVAASTTSDSAMSDTAQSVQSQNELISTAMDGGFPDEWKRDVLAALCQPTEESPNKWPLTQEEYKRYGRQLIMPEVGLQGQLRLKAAKVLIVGCGGLGCPAALYLAGAGVGTIGLVDGDTVEESNLHRQVLHNERRIGWAKVDSAMQGLKAYVHYFLRNARLFLRTGTIADQIEDRLNSAVTVVPHKTRLEPQNALHIFAAYDVVLDCTDTPASRYLISDTCVLLGKPLVSASALRTEGQLMVLNYPSRPAGDPGGGPCYRCVFPKPPPPETVTSCGDGGILGPVVGIMGLLQSLEAIKVITAGATMGDMNNSTISASFAESSLSPPSLLLFSAYSSPQFRSIKLRTRKITCAACSSQATITANAFTSGSMDYIQFCGLTNPINILTPNERISAPAYAETRKITSITGKQHQVIDVREKVQYDLCHLFGSVNVPFSQLSQLPDSWEAIMKDEEAKKVLQLLKTSFPRFEGDPVYVVCRLGNDSQVAVKKLKGLGLDNGGKTWVGDIRGGLRAWREEVDGTFPEY
ncbi:hypothetical protein E6O75_ATG01397 [Venturia nashicola]|uniref:Adenylyltransferase and sulfurtransferase uba4 n=1 Tax=Venturia nashicola TaxID=86259 RepID=A0A4Z1PGV4_9PEZI|nr:hypothetical protein E6O75_ATG01397 [Venturia nashicola]